MVTRSRASRSTLRRMLWYVGSGKLILMKLGSTGDCLLGWWVTIPKTESPDGRLGGAKAPERGSWLLRAFVPRNWHFRGSERGDEARHTTNSKSLIRMTAKLVELLPLGSSR